MFHKTVSYLCYFHLAAGTGGRKYFGHSCLVLSRSLSLLLIIIMSSLKIGQSSNLKNHSILTRSGPFSSCFILLMYSSQVRSFGLIVCWKISYENIFLIAREFSQFNDNLILKKQRGFEPVQQHRRCRKSSLRKLNGLHDPRILHLLLRVEQEWKGVRFNFSDIVCLEIIRDWL